MMLDGVGEAGQVEEDAISIGMDSPGIVSIFLSMSKLDVSIWKNMFPSNVSTRVAWKTRAA